MQAVPNDLQKQAADPVSPNCDTLFDSAVTVYPILTEYEDAVWLDTSLTESNTHYERLLLTPLRRAQMSE